MRIDELIAGLDVRLLEGGTAALSGRVCDITEDSRTVLPGSLFIARKGEKADAAKFIPDAIAAGAVAILTDNPKLVVPPIPSHTARPPHAPASVALLYADDVPLATAKLAERFYGNPSSKLRLIGVTGTNGKTTTTFLIHQLLNTLGIRCGLIGTVCIDDGVEVAPASLTTPPALEISRTLARMHEAGCTAAAIEVSSHSLVQHRVAALNFDAAVFTNLTGDHLDYHGTQEAYGDAKAMLFNMLGTDAHAIVNADDATSSRILKNCRAHATRCGITTMSADYRAMVRSTGATWTECEFAGPQGGIDVRLPLVGEFNVMNALEAVTAVHRVYGGTGKDDLPLARIAEALGKCHTPPGRLEPVTRDDAPFAVFVDYAHTDDALRTVLSVLCSRVKPGGTLWCVFGCGGDRDKTKRPRMGAAAAELADRVIVTSDNPRTEDPRRIIDDIMGGIDLGQHIRVTIEPDRERAIRAAISRASAGDIVLIAGKGHEDYQILPAPPTSTAPDTPTPGGTITVPFDDREAARKLLSLRGITPRKPTPLAAAGYAPAAGEGDTVVGGDETDDELMIHGVGPAGEDQAPSSKDATQP